MPDENTIDNIPPGFILRHTLRGHSDWIGSIAWSPDGKIVASPSVDQTIRLWDAQTGQHLRTREGHSNSIISVAWSPDGKTLASGADDKTIRLWDAQTGRHLRTLKGHSNSVSSVTWSPDGKTLASGSIDKTIRIWNLDTGQQTDILEVHTGNVRSVSFSYDGSLLASKSNDGTVRLWRTGTWETVATLGEPASYYWPPSVAFHPNAPILATLGEKDTVIRIWELDFATLLGNTPITHSFYYTNAKVVLVGDSGVGKSGLGLVLTGQPFVPTESTHGRSVWTFESREVELDNLRKETRQTMLWDLAGQPGYRLIHQLHLNEVAVALVLFDARSETDPFAGVYHWDRALRQAQRVQDNS